MMGQWTDKAMLAAMVCTLTCCSCRSRSHPQPGPSDSTAGQPGFPNPSNPTLVPGRLQPDALTYTGAFRLPPAFDWGARGLAFHPFQRGELLVTGHDQRPAEFAPVGIIQPIAARHPSQLPIAPLRGPIRSFDGNIVESVTDTAFSSGIEVVLRQGQQHTDKLYGSLSNWYGVVEESHPTIWFSEMDGSHPRGPFHVGPRTPQFHGNRSGAFLFKVPDDYASRYLGGRFLVTGNTRGAFNGSQGPALIAFRPFDSENPSGDLDAVLMLAYRIHFPACAGPNVGDPKACDLPGFTMCDSWQGASFVHAPSGSAILLVGKKGLGPNRYGEPHPGACGESKGYHCDPFERQVLFYDVDELGAVALGRREPWSVLPYAIWRPGEFFLQGRTCGDMGDMAYDPSGRRLFIIEKGIGENNGAVVHVWTTR